MVTMVIIIINMIISELNIRKIINNYWICLNKVRFFTTLPSPNQICIKGIIKEKNILFIKY